MDDPLPRLIPIKIKNKRLAWSSIKKKLRQKLYLSSHCSDLIYSDW